MASRAEAYLAAGRPRDALQAAHDGLAAVARTAEQFYEAELHRLLGEALLAADGDVSEAQAAFRRGVEVATRQGANLFALRAAVSLMTLAKGTGDTRELLSSVRQSLPPTSDLAEVSAADTLLAK
jgi:predicted negative regulator of RcsB-dependent stress response